MNNTGKQESNWAESRGVLTLQGKSRPQDNLLSYSCSSENQTHKLGEVKLDS